MPRIDSGQDAEPAGAPRTRTGRCACGALRITVTGEPIVVHACSCATCQRSTGSAFAYSSFFQRGAVTSIEGERRTWRRIAGSGRAVDSAFCPTCGVTVFVDIDAFPDAVGIPVGCFADPGFPPPRALCWASLKHGWLSMPPDVVLLKTQ